MNPYMLVWNIRGVGNLVSLGKLNKLVKQWKQKIVVLLEPFISFDRINKVANKLQLYHSCSNGVQGGKIWILWDDGVAFDFIQSCSAQSISGMVNVVGF